jgi:hypothetical protein
MFYVLLEMRLFNTLALGINPQYMGAGMLAIFASLESSF